MTSFGVRMQRPVKTRAGSGSGLDRNRVPFYDPRESSSKGITYSTLSSTGSKRQRHHHIPGNHRYVNPGGRHNGWGW